jgi:hypothetical protein
MPGSCRVFYFAGGMRTHVRGFDKIAGAILDSDSWRECAPAWDG